MYGTDNRANDLLFQVHYEMFCLITTKIAEEKKKKTRGKQQEQLRADARFATLVNRFADKRRRAKMTLITIVMASYGNVPTAEFKHTHHQTITSPSSWVSSMQSLLMIYICFIALLSSFFVCFALFCFAAFVRLSRALVSHSHWDLISLIMHKYVQSSTIVTASGSFIHWPLCDFLF